MEQKTLIGFYHNLSKLFYAIASCDKRVEPIEFRTFVNNISGLTPKELFSCSDNVNSKYLMTYLFNSLHLEAYKASTCYEDFIAYMKEHPELFTDKIKQVILKTAGLIASSFSAKNKSELIMLAKLEIEFKKLKMI